MGGSNSSPSGADNAAAAAAAATPSGSLETPCVPERELWRNCMKRNDYQPDRDLRSCNETRADYYTCINAWRAANPPPKDRAPVGTVHPLCTGLSDRLRTCMEIYMFETHRCQNEMARLRECVATVDKEVSSVKADWDADSKKRQDAEMAEKAGLSPGGTPAQQAIWSELWEKKPQWGQEGRLEKPRV